MSIGINNNKEVLDGIRKLDEKFTKRFDGVETEMRQGFETVNKRLDGIQSDIKGLAQGQIEFGGILDRITDQEFKDQVKAHREKLEEIANP